MIVNLRHTVEIINDITSAIGKLHQIKDRPPILARMYAAGRTMDETFGLIETVEKAAQVYMLTAGLPRVGTITDEQLKLLGDSFGVKYRKDFLNL